MILDLVGGTGFLVAITVFANVTLKEVANMALGLHVLPKSIITVECRETGMATVLRVFVLRLVARILQVVFEMLLDVEQLAA